jgi:hypothetical protein
MLLIYLSFPCTIYNRYRDGFQSICSRALCLVNKNSLKLNNSREYLTRCLRRYIIKFRVDNAHNASTGKNKTKKKEQICKRLKVHIS